MDYERSFLHEPDQVFAALLTVLLDQGLVESISGYGTAVTFSVGRHHRESDLVLTARVSPWHGGTLLVIAPAYPCGPGRLDDEKEYRSVIRLLGCTGDRLAVTVG